MSMSSQILRLMWRRFSALFTWSCASPNSAWTGGMGERHQPKIEALEQIAAQAAYDNACARASQFINCAIENAVCTVGVADTVEMLKAHIMHLEEFE
ncbi:MAG TPA: hypothetical protein PKE19_00200 [Aestuariivirga sp.]|nr:hypothetical protein [Aestuariivirga sp.]